jgi:hypothetical protein
MFRVHVGSWVRMALARTVGLALALVLLAPILLGPAIGPVTRALGGEAQHLCACGMIAGTCGCPECEKIEHQRHRQNLPRAYPVIKGQCGGEDTPVAFAPLPNVAPASVSLLVPKPAVRVVMPLPIPRWASLDPVEPPTPPPEDLRRS